MQDFFISMYEWVHHSQPNPAFRDLVYADVGLCLFGLTALTVLVYYYVLNVFSARFARRGHWLLVMLLNIVLNVVAVAWVEDTVPDLAVFSPPSFTLMIIDGCYALVGYLALSILVKWGSKNARRTPF